MSETTAVIDLKWTTTVRMVVGGSPVSDADEAHIQALVDAFGPFQSVGAYCLSGRRVNVDLIGYFPRFHTQTLNFEGAKLLPSASLAP